MDKMFEMRKKVEHPPIHIVSPSVSYDKRPLAPITSYEYDSLLARTRLSVRPFPPAYDPECGGGRSSSQWQVVCALKGVLCATTHHALELVHLKRTYFGVRWRDTDLERDTDMPPSCMMGPHWHLMLITWSIFFILASLINGLTYKKASVVEVGAGVVLSVLCLICYALVGCSNPGIVERIEVPPDDTYTYCDHCDSYRPERALHCMDCQVCVEEYDHHCPWTGKCVGKGNVRYFYGWLFFLVLAFVYEVIEFSTYLLPPNHSLKIITPISMGT